MIERKSKTDAKMVDFSILEILEIFFGGIKTRPADCEVLTIKLRGINYQFSHLVFQKSPYGTSRWFQSRPRFYMAPASADILYSEAG